MQDQPEKAAPKRLLIPRWFKLKRGLDFSMHERFIPPVGDQGLLARIRAHWQGDYSEGWPDPKEFRVWFTVVNAPDTMRWAYRRLKRRFSLLARAA